MNESIYINSKPIDVSSYSDYKIATFLISVLDEWDLNHRLIPKATGERCHKSIIGFPILAKLIKDKYGNPIDYGGHELRYKTNKKGVIEANFGTTAIGSVIDSWIEERKIDGYDEEKACILIKAKLWSSRFPEYFDVFENLYYKNQITSSWEISVMKSKKVPQGKILEDIVFIGNTLLGSNVLGAIPNAGVVEYYETLECADYNNPFKYSDLLLAEALTNDVLKSLHIDNNEKEENNMILSKEKDSKNNSNMVNNSVNSVENSHSKSVLASELTDNDIRKKIIQAWEEKYKEFVDIFLLFPGTNTAWIRKWDYKATDTDYMIVTYSIEKDELILGEPKDCKLTVAIPDIDNVLETKNNIIIEMSNQIKALSDEIEKLKPFKDKVEEMERVQREAELQKEKAKLSEYAIKSGYITQDEIENSKEIKDMINNLDIVGIKSIIADRLVGKFSNNENKSNIETSCFKQKIPNVNLVGNDDYKTRFSIKDYLKS